MKRDFLKTLGLTDDQIDSIMSEHGKSINAEKSKIADNTADLDNAKKEIEEFKKQIEQLEKFKGSTAELEKQLQDFKAEREAETAEREAAQKYNAYVEQLKGYIPEGKEFMNSYAKDGVFKQAIENFEKDNTKGLQKCLSEIIQDEKGNFLDGIFSNTVQAAEIPPTGSTAESEKADFEALLEYCGIPNE